MASPRPTPKIGDRVKAVFLYPRDSKSVGAGDPQHVRSGSIVEIASGIATIEFDPTTTVEEEQGAPHKENVSDLKPDGKDRWIWTGSPGGLPVRPT
jgi:hypothetical protein